ncbi:MAG: hypothetical protein C4314_05995, partial [Thermoflexus sp.]
MPTPLPGLPDPERPASTGLLTTQGRFLRPWPDGPRLIRFQLHFNTAQQNVKRNPRGGRRGIAPAPVPLHNGVKGPGVPGPSPSQTRRQPAMADRPRIAVLGGTGKEGSGLALRWARAGFPVAIGSRDLERARAAVERLRPLASAASLYGLTNAEAAAWGEVVVIAVPYEGHGPLLEALRETLRGKRVIDVVVPLDPQNPRRYAPPPEGSATA